MKSFPPILIALLLAAGCNKPSPSESRQPPPNVVIYDRDHQAIAWLHLSLSAGAKQISGSWHLISFKSPFPAGSMAADGKSTVQNQGKEVWIDLNPGVADSNVVLRGIISNGNFSGEWLHATYAGGIPQGSFEATLDK